MKYIKRDIERKIEEVSSEYSCVLVTGARQVGKTTVLKKLMTDDRDYISLDDLTERRLAKNDPAMFLQTHNLPILIDEVQYAPELFTYIKMAVDEGAKPGTFWLTGSQPFRLMELARETMSGRVAIIHMTTLSQHEIYGCGESKSFSVDLEKLRARKETNEQADMKHIYERIWKGSMPGMLSEKFTNRDIFYSSYIQTYIERDVGELLKGVDSLRFSDFVRSAACRIGQVTKIHDIANDVGISDDTAKKWLKILEKSGVIFFLRPYSNNLLKRTIKTPKMYFYDTGLVSYLTKYSSAEILENGAINGAILENYVVSEIKKTYINNAEECLLWYYRDKDANEIDMVLESDGKLHPIEIKRSVDPHIGIINTFKILDKGNVPRDKGAVICMHNTLSAIDSNTLIVPIWMI